MERLIETIKACALCTLLILVFGCAGIEPYDPPDYREEPPVQGLLSGETGEFVVYRKNKEAVMDSENDRKNHH